MAQFDEDNIRLAITDGLTETFGSNQPMSSPPEFEQKPLFFLTPKKIRVSSYDTTFVKSFISVISLYATSAAKSGNKPSGVMIVYIKESAILRLVKAMKMLSKDEKPNQTILLDLSGQLASMIADSFKKKMQGIEEVSNPINGMNRIKQGVNLPGAQKFSYQLKAFFYDINAIIIDIIL